LHDVDPDAPELVVGIGASAGGIGALTRFFTHAPADAPVAYVVILHLSPDHESKLAELLQRVTPLAVTQVRDTIRLQPRHVYVIPPNRSLKAVGETLELSEEMRVEERKAPIDIFFRTLADVYEARAVAVVLSGTGSDGSMGLKRVKEHGGLTVTQKPEDAEYGEMPTHAVATSLVDYILPAEDIPARIVDYFRHLGSSPVQRAADPLHTEEDEAVRDILRLLRARTSQDFSDYKPATIRRRIARRMSLHELPDVAEYARYLKGHADEASALMKDLLISVTNFFRDAPAWQALERLVIPRLFVDRDATDHIRVWSAGSATGEEAYSLAMLLAEQATGLLAVPRLQIFATDLDESVIQIARDGIYSEADVADVSAVRLQRFFNRESAGYRVRRELREMVLFAHHNVIKDPPFSHLDLIVCRNLLIYLNRASQQRVLETFQFALRRDGFLFLGGSETAEERPDLYEALDKSLHIYQVRPAAPRPHLATFDVPRPVPIPPPLPDIRPPDHLSPGDLHLRLLEQFAAPSIVVTDDHMVVHMSEGVSDFLRIPGGEPSRDVLKLIRPELRADLRTALLIASQQRTPTAVRAARMPRDGTEIGVSIQVRPVMRAGSPSHGYFLVIFEVEHAPPSEPEPTELVTRSEGETEQLHNELARVNEQLRLTLERSAVQVEEAKAANEELQAMNEELRSSAEELETSKEELQSSNEELATVNQELKIKIEELAATNNDFQNLITSTEMGAIFLDRSLRVKLSTPRAQQVFNLRPGDVGRQLSDITSRLVYEHLFEDVAAVLRHLQTVEREVKTKDASWYSVRIHPYRTSDDRIEGVAITFQDISARKQVEEQLRGGEERLRLLIDSAVDYAIFTMDGDGCIDSWNAGAERVFGYAAHEVLGVDAAILFTPEDRAAGVPAQELGRAAQTGRADDERWHVRKSGQRFYCSGVTTRLGEDSRRGFVKIARDLTEQRQHEEALEQARANLERRVETRTAELQAEVAQRSHAQQQVMRLLYKLVTAQEDERARVARDLHDQLGQQLTALRLALERHRESLPQPSSTDVHLDRALALARQVDDAVDYLAWELRPAALDDLGLVAALPRFLDEWAAYHGIPANFQMTGTLAARLSAEAEITFYRIAQEALNNVVKHAHATRVDVVLEAKSDSVLLIVEDDGVGFDSGAADSKPTGIGIVGMHERSGLIGGTLQIESTPGKGTTVYLRYPLQQPEPS
jgi:two-component system, chemotaxis family, CheB/CheR fusion protein